MRLVRDPDPHPHGVGLRALWRRFWRWLKDRREDRMPERYMNKVNDWDKEH